MTPRDFVYWLQGFLEISGREHIEPRQLSIIKDHISLVLEKQTPFLTINPARPAEPDEEPMGVVENADSFDKGGFYTEDSHLWPESSFIIDGKDVPHTC